MTGTHNHLITSLDALEQIYGALESHDTGPEPAGRAGVAA